MEKKQSEFPRRQEGGAVVYSTEGKSLGDIEELVVELVKEHMAATANKTEEK